MIPLTTVVTGYHSLSTFRQTAGAVNLLFSFPEKLFSYLLENDGKLDLPDIQQGVVSSLLCHSAETLEIAHYILPLHLQLQRRHRVVRLLL